MNTIMRSYSVLFSEAHRTYRHSKRGNRLRARPGEYVVGDGRQSGSPGLIQCLVVGSGRQSGLPRVEQDQKVEDRPGLGMGRQTTGSQRREAGSLIVLIRYVPEHIINQPLEHGRGVGQTKWHHQILIVLLWGVECRLLLVPLPDVD